MKTIRWFKESHNHIMGDIKDDEGVLCGQAILNTQNAPVRIWLNGDYIGELISIELSKRACEAIIQAGLCR